MNSDMMEPIILTKRKYFSKLKLLDEADFDNQDLTKKIHLDKIIQSNEIQRGGSDPIFTIPENEISLPEPANSIVSKEKPEDLLLDNINNRNGPESESNPTWEWSRCEPLNLNNSPSENEISTNLSPQDVKITMNKPFMYDSQLGWNWHKGWNLPVIKIQLNKKRTIGIMPNTRIQVKLDAIIPIAKSQNTKQAKFIKLNGETIQYISKGKATFYGIKFTETSFKNDGLKFKLIISLALEHKHNKKSINPQALITLKSPHLFVDSRKASRDTFDMKRQKIILKYFTPFHPSLLARSIELKLCNTYHQIQNDLEGLCQYLGSSSLKNKIKHPFYLIFKFSNCIQLYYNPRAIKVNPNENKTLEYKIIEEMQHILWSIQDSYTKQKQKNIENPSIDDMSFFILIEEPTDSHSFHLTKTISENLEIIENEKLHFTFNHNKIPKHFWRISSAKLAEGYARNFVDIQKMQKREENADDLSNSLELKIKNSDNFIVKSEKIEEVEEEENNEISSNLSCPELNLLNNSVFNHNESKKYENLIQFVDNQKKNFSHRDPGLNLAYCNPFNIGNPVPIMPRFSPFQFETKNLGMKSIMPLQIPNIQQSSSLQNLTNNPLSNLYKLQMAQRMVSTLRPNLGINTLDNLNSSIANLKINFQNQHHFLTNTQQNGTNIPTFPSQLLQMMITNPNNGN